MSLKDDFIDDAVSLGGELLSTAVKIGLAYLALAELGNLDHGDAIATAALLGGVDFFNRRPDRSRVVHDVKRKIVAKLPGGEKITESSEDYTETR